MKKWMIQKWPVLCVIAIYWAAVGILLAISIHMNQGHLVYALDDPYIHMAVAKNTVQHGVWGVTKYGFSNTTSSPLWTGLLALTYLLFGVNEISPLILNLLFGTLALIVLYFLLDMYLRKRIVLFIVLLTVLFSTPLPSLTLAGMEHIPHIFLTIFFLYHFIILFSPAARQRNIVVLVALSAIIPIVRYEGLILVFAASVLFVLKGRAKVAIMIGVAALVPVAIYGFWSVSNGWYFLPNSVLLKGNMPGFNLSAIANYFLGYDLLSRLQGNVHLLFLLLPAALLFIFYFRKEKPYPSRMLALAVFMATTLLHVQLAATGWFYRYEAYLVFMGLAILATSIPDVFPNLLNVNFKGNPWPHNLAQALFLVLVASPFVLRAYDSIRITPDASNNIYEQQYQMGLFLARFYPGETIAANDIGAIDYLADIQLLDLWGLGSMQVAESRMHKRYNTAEIDSLARDAHVSIAIVYDGWYDEFGGLPAHWYKAGSWQVPHNVVLGGDTVSFYAVNPSERYRLIQSLNAFKTELPADIKQFGVFTQRN